MLSLVLRRQRALSAGCPRVGTIWLGVVPKVKAQNSLGAGQLPPLVKDQGCQTDSGAYSTCSKVQPPKVQALGNPKEVSKQGHPVGYGHESTANSSRAGGQETMVDPARQLIG